MKVNAKNYKKSEFVCPCGCGLNNISDDLVICLQALRFHFKKPVVITSGCRCKKYNRSLVGSVPNSAHLRGCAADIYISGVSPKKIHDFWQKNKFGYSYYGTKNMGTSAHVEI